MKPSSELLAVASALLLSLVLQQPARAEVRVPSLIGENMVLQQGPRARVWGWARPGERVSVEVAGRRAQTAADARGRWQVFVGPLKAGGPHTLTIKGDNTLTFTNVLVGEVWVCSGQSNMEWPLSNTEGGARQVAEADWKGIRLFTVAKNTAPAPLEDVEGRWLVTTPQTAAGFSAVGYFFGRELHKSLGVPVGLVHSSWGGTPAEAWTSRAALASSPALAPILERYERELGELPRLEQEYARASAEWARKYLTEDPGNKGEAQGFADPARDSAGWKKMRLPGLWEPAGLDVDGVVWFRRELNVSAAWAGRDLSLGLGAIDDFDTTYFNGERVGATGPETPNSWTTPRRYRIPGRLVRAGRNVVAVRVYDRIGGGGFNGGDMSLAPADDPKQGALPLGGEWDYKAEFVVPAAQIDYSTQPQPPGPRNQNNPTVLYNAMLAPLTPFRIRGAVWYQGESNAGRAYQYRTLFPSMINDWRKAWGAGDFPFYFVQLASWRPARPEPAESDWAELREAQLLTLRRVPGTGMAVAIDIGDPADIHPRNKLDVGLRLARWALRQTYGQKVVPSGPLYTGYNFEEGGSRVRVHFEHAAGLKTRDGSAPRGFAVAGEDRKFVWAEARVEGDAVVVWSPRVPRPVAVRYGWADSPASNLYNGAGLPASPFRTDDWPGLTESSRQ